MIYGTDVRADYWEAMWGSRYCFPNFKDTAVREAVNAVELSGGERPLIIDYGCGFYPVSGMIRPRAGVQPITTLVDIAGEEPDGRPRMLATNDPVAASGDFSKLVMGDLDEMAKSTPSGKRAVDTLARFLSKHSVDGRPLADLGILSEVLNYVDFRKVLELADRFMRLGGTMLVINEAWRGNVEAFSAEGVSIDAHIGFVLEHDLGYDVSLAMVDRNLPPEINGVVSIYTATKTREK